MDVGRLSPLFVRGLVGDVVIVFLGLGLKEDKLLCADWEVQFDVEDLASVLAAVDEGCTDAGEVGFVVALAIFVCVSDADVEAV